MRRAAWAVLLLSILAVVPGAITVAAADPCVGTSPTDPAHRVARIEPKPAGTVETYCLFFGPYTIPPGHDVSRLDGEVTLAPGFMIAGGPSVVDADGREPSAQAIHIHHAHWWFLDPEGENHGPDVPGWVWISGSGEEETEGDFGLVADAEPGGPRYGLRVRAGERVLFINMLHNKTSQPAVLFVRVWLRFVHGSAEEIFRATGLEYQNLTPVLVGGSFHVRRGAGRAGAGEYVYPRDYAGAPPEPDIVPGVGRVWTAPFSGAMVIGAGHVHPGGKKVIVTNWGRAGDPCENTRTDDIPGTTMYELETLYRTVPWSEDFQIEITQPGFRAWVRAGDRIVLNGVYESAEHSWFDAMTHTGFYIARGAVPNSKRCVVERVGVPAGYQPPFGPAPTEAWEGVPNREWHGAPAKVCGVPGSPACDRNRPAAAPGPRVNEVLITGFNFTPGSLDAPPGAGPPQVVQNSTVRFLNSDYLTALIRHTVTACTKPCDGEYVANYPLPNGDFDSGFLGYEPTTGGGYPYFELPTAGLSLGRHTFFCRIHPWMRGALDVVAA